ncbi:MAG: ABC transporter ATP-binding protein [Luteimonas sp.]
MLVIQDIGKAYVKYSSELHRFARWVGMSSKPDTESWVLRHVSFRVDKGEAVGIIGQNGAGKSTLLKLITGTCRPTEGQVEVYGRIAALLELGLGFNQELTGRENAIHSAGLMGISQHEIARLLPEIESFAEIGDYFDAPMRTYSSGMQVRVAFSVATAVRPEVLIVDEALAVGDAYFVHKCFQRIREFREAGTTLLIVSHDPGAILSLCDRAILLESGRLISEGTPQEVLDYYNALVSEKENSTVRTERNDDGSVITVSGTGEAVVEEVYLLDAAGERVEYLGVGAPTTLVVKARTHESIDRLVMGYMIRDRLGQPVFGTNTHHTDQAVENIPAGTVIEYRAKFPMNLGVGTFSISVALSSTETHMVKNYQWRDLALVFTVANLGQPLFVGVAWVPPVIEIQHG